jgi:hypothetical protein
MGVLDVFSRIFPVRARSVRVGFVSTLSVALSVALALQPAEASVVKVYSSNSDFNLGQFTSVENSTIPNQVQLIPGSSQTQPYIYIANHVWGTLSKVDTRDGREVARYPVCINNVGNTNLCPTNNPSWRPQAYCNWSNSGHCPSRTTADLNGDIWVANRTFGGQGSVTKVAGEIGHCVDRNNDGVITTSQDLNGNGRIDIVEDGNMPDGPSANGEWRGQADECVLGTYPVGGHNQWPRGLTIDGQNRIWVSTHQDGMVYARNALTGAQVASVSTGHNIYGLAADSLGFVYTSNLVNGWISQINTTLPTPAKVKELGMPFISYGLATEKNSQTVWLAPWVAQGRITRMRFSDNTATTFQAGDWAGTHTRGVAVANDGRVWISNWSTNQVRFYNPANNTWGPIYGVASGPIGVAIDPNNNIWTSNYYAENATKLVPSTGAVSNSSQIGVAPYSYSDMTGYQLTQGVVQQGTWSVINDGGIEDLEWGSIFLNEGAGQCPAAGCIPPGTQIYVEARCSNNPQPSGQWTIVSTGSPFVPVQKGRYFEVRAVLRIQGFQPTFMSPVLTDMRVLPAAPTLTGFSPASVPVGFSGAVQLTGKNFTNELTVNFGPGITVNSVVVNTATSATVNITVPASTSAGAKTVTINNGAHGATSSAFQVTLAAPTVASITPSFVLPGSTTSLSFVGTALTPAATATASVGSAANKTYQSLTGFTLDYTAPATPQSVNFTVANATGSTTVTAGVRVYGITGVVADPISVGSTGTVTISAVGLQGNEEFDLGGGVNVTNAQFGAGTVTLTVVVSGNAPLGAHDVSMTAPGLGLTHGVPGALMINPAGGGGGGNNDLPTPPAGCAEWSYQGRPYAYCSTARTWANAQAHCISTGMQLVAVSHAAEKQWLTGQLQTVGASSVWIGLQATGGTYGTWVSGQAASYLAWASGEPNLTNGCAYQTAGSWGDQACGQLLGFVCEGQLPSTAPELIGLWYFNDGEGSAFVDSSGNGFHGGAAGPFSWTPSALQDVLAPTSSSQGAALRLQTLASGGATLGYAPSAASTLESWLNILTVPSSLTPIVSANGSVEIAVGPGTGGLTTLACSVALNDGTNVSTVAVSAGLNLASHTPPWHHVACVYDGAAVTLYLNGVAAATQAGSGTVEASPGPIAIGGGAFAIDNLAYWSIALDAQTIQEHATDGSVTNNNGVTPGVPAPAVGSAAPTAAGAGQTVVVELEGSNFTSGTTVDFGPGITVLSVDLIDSNHLSVEVSVGAEASLGVRNIKVTTSFGVAVLPQAFSVFGVTSMGPAVAQAGGSGVSLTFTGYGFSSQDVFNFGPGITVVGATLIDASTCVVTVDIAANAVLGTRDVTITGPQGNVTVYSGVFTISGPNIILWTTPQDFANSNSSGIDLSIKPGSAFLAPFNGVNNYTLTDGVLDAGLGVMYGAGQVTVAETAAGLVMDGYGGGCVHLKLPKGSFKLNTKIKVNNILSNIVELFGFSGPGPFLPNVDFFEAGFSGLFMTADGALGWYKKVAGQLLYWNGSEWVSTFATFASNLLGQELGIEISFVDGELQITIKDPLGLVLTVVGNLVLPGLPNLYFGTVSELGGGIPQFVNMVMSQLGISDPWGVVENFAGNALSSAWNAVGGLFGGGFSVGGGSVNIGFNGGGFIGRGWPGGKSWKSKGRWRIGGGGGGGGGGGFSFFGFGGGGGGGGGGWSWGGGGFGGGGGGGSIFGGSFGSWLGSGMCFNVSTGQLGWFEYDGNGNFWSWDGSQWLMNQVAWIPNTLASIGKWFRTECRHSEDENGNPIIEVDLYTDNGVLITTINGFQIAPTLNDPGFYLGSPTSTWTDGAPTVGSVEFDSFGIEGDIEGYGYMPSGNITVGAYDAGSATNWGVLSIGGALPAGTGVRLRLRVANDPATLLTLPFLGPNGSASAWFYGGELIGAPFDGFRYVQWLAELTTSDPNVSPELLDVIIPVQEIPTVGTVSPASASAGQTLEVQVTGTAFDSSTTVSFGPNVTVLSTDVISQNLLRANVQIDAVYTPGTRTVTVTTTAGQGSKANGFALSGLSSINTPGGEQGATLVVQLSGFGLSAPFNLSFGQGVTVQSQSLVGSTTINATLLVSEDAFFGGRDVTITYGGGATSTLPGAFQVYPPANCPNNCSLGLTKVVPNVVSPTGGTEVTLQGTNFGTGLGVSATNGVTSSGLALQSAKFAKVTLNVPASTTFTSFGLTVSRGAESFTVANAVKVLRLNSMSVSSLPVGASTTFTVAGAGFVSGLGVSVNLGPAVSITSLTVVSETQLSVTATVAAGAILGPRNLVVTVGSATASISNAFELLAPPDSKPVLTSVSPDKALRGSSLEVTLNGNNFAYGMTANFGVGMALSGCMVQSRTAMTCNLAIAAGTTTGPRDASVTTLYGSSIKVGAFLVQDNGCAGVVCNTPPGPCYNSPGTCNPATGSCSYTLKPAGSTCTDSLACTVGNTCNAAGACGTPQNSACNDAIPCTIDTCDPVAGCVNAPGTAACDDYTCPKGGDINGNGKIEVSDAMCTLLVANWQLAGANPVTKPACAANPAWADLNCSGTTNVQDAQLLIQYALNQTLPRAVDHNANTCVDACDAEDCGDGFCDPQESCIICPQDCGSCTGDCCLPHSTFGCGNEAVMDCVCAKNADCCYSNGPGWSQLCVNIATSQCSLTCE